MDDSDPYTSLLVKILILLFLILANAFFAMSEIAIISLNDSKIRRMAEEGNKKAIQILKLVENPSSFLSTIQTGVTFAGFLTSASAAGNFSEPLANRIAGLLNIQNPATLALINGISLVIVTLIISFFSLVLGELVPKRMAMQKSEAISFRVVGLLLFVKAVMRPFIFLLTVSTNFVLRVFGYDPEVSHATVTEEEIRMLVDAGEEKGVIEESQKEMINNIFEFDDIVAADVMTHRTDIVAVEINQSLNDVLEQAISEGYSRIPVYKEDLDEICGIIHVKDLLQYVGKNLVDCKISDIMREPYFVPESKRCRDLFNEMTEKKLQMVIVLDEYGGTAGLVTIEDLLESIVGSIQDEYDDEQEEYQKLSDNVYTFEGTSDIEEIEQILGVKLPEGEYDTIGGFIMSVIGRIPQPGEHPVIEANGYSFTVEEAAERRITRVRAEKLNKPKEAAGTDK
ncbi:MAG TPA: HlyC/CorC family transporter [Clostridiales bacterium]|nr:HlyC/CorC family transporter [Clostridiales bacterium]